MNEYTLTTEEQALLDSIAADVQALQAEGNAILKRIIRAHKLPDGNWALEDGKLNRSE